MGVPPRGPAARRGRQPAEGSARGLSRLLGKAGEKGPSLTEVRGLLGTEGALGSEGAELKQIPAESSKPSLLAHTHPPSSQQRCGRCPRPPGGRGRARGATQAGGRT